MQTYLRSFCIAEYRSLDLNATFAFPSSLPYLGTDVLTFSVTVGPDEQSLAVLGLLSDISCDWLLVLVPCERGICHA